MVHGVLGATPIQILLLFFGWAGAGLPFNSAFWFMGLIIQLYLVFPFLCVLLKDLGERKFLLATSIVSVALLYLLPMIWVGLFVGGWLFEFCVGMVIADHYSRVESLLRGIRNTTLLLLAYLVGLMLSNFKATWPLGRPLYGIALTLFIWSIYNTAGKTGIFNPIRRFLVFMGLIAFPMWLINQPFMQEYYLLFASGDLIFWNEIVGDPANFKILPISKFLLVKLNYIVLIIALSFILTRLDEQIARKTASWQLNLAGPHPPSSSPHPYPPPHSPRDLSEPLDASEKAIPQYSQDETVQIEKEQLDDLLNQNEMLISRCRELLQSEKDLKVRIALMEEELNNRGVNAD
jgi:peptidoglycan/LPS O-acetylase OafA/YrhL